MKSEATSPSLTWIGLSLFAIPLLLGLVFISPDSLWIDEGYAASKALQGSLAEWYRALVEEGGSDAQMPGYMLFIWAWAKVAGGTELALRLSK